jgi:hypothetical protein
LIFGVLPLLEFMSHLDALLQSLGLEGVWGVCVLGREWMCQMSLNFLKWLLIVTEKFPKSFRLPRSSVGRKQN